MHNYSCNFFHTVLFIAIGVFSEPELKGLDEQEGYPPRTGDRPPMTQQSRVSFAEGTTFERERTSKIKATTGGKMLSLEPQVVALIISLPGHFCL